MLKVLCTVGPSGGGKNTVFKRLVAAYPYLRIIDQEIGDICRYPDKYPMLRPDQAKRLHQSQVDAVWAKDEDVLSAVTMVLSTKLEIDPELTPSLECLADRADLIVLDGLRTPNQYHRIHAWFARLGIPLAILNLHTPLDVCLDRLMRADRGRSDDGNIEKCRRRIQHYVDDTVGMTGEMRRSSGFCQVDGTDAFTVDLEPLYAHLGLPTGIRRVLSRNIPFLRKFLRPRRPAWAHINEQTEFGLVSPETVTQETNGSVVVTG